MKEKLEKLEKQILSKMEERGYVCLSQTTTNERIIYTFHIAQSKTDFIVDVIVEDDKVYFQFKTLIAKIFQISSDKIGCFFDDEHFNKIEEKFSPVAFIADHII